MQTEADMSKAEKIEVPFAPHPKDPRKPGAILTLEIECAVQSCVLPSGQTVYKGVNLVEVREDYVKKVKALVADPEEVEGGVRTNPSKIDEAKRNVEEAKAEHLRVTGASEWKYAQHTYDGPRTWVQEYVRRNFVPVAGIYKSVLPLRAVRVVGEPKPQPPSDSERLAQDQLRAQSEALAMALAKHLGVSQAQPQPKRRG
jgi:hypothetical protein